MSGYQLVLKIRRLEQEIDALGFRWGNSKNGGTGLFGHDFGETVALFPKDDGALPVYRRDAELFTGTIEDLEIWLRGVQWSRNYDRLLLGKSIETNRLRKEQDYRNRELIKILSKVGDEE
jgi:hypothetical protein